MATGLDQEKLRTFDDIDVQLVSAIAQPYETSVASARTCYSGKGVIWPAEVSRDEKAVALRDRIASSTMEAGHITTRQHAHFVFAISGISRHCIWSFLHGHPFYNSEQVSQRYVRVKRGSFIVPPLSDKAQKIYLETIDAQMAAYEKLIEVLKKPLAEDFFSRFKARAKQPEKWMGAVDKRSFEVARYVLSVGTTAYLYHTISALTLLRYAKLCELFETPDEQRVLVRKMLDCVKAIDPLFEKDVPDAFPLESTLEHEWFTDFKANCRPRSLSFVRDFETTLMGRVSKLVTYTKDAEWLLAQAARVSTGRVKSDLSDEKAVQMLLDPAHNKVLADTLNPSTMDKMSQVLHHVHFTFQKKLSHTADSQDQRHRTVLSSRPFMFFHFNGQPDYITPFGITQSAEAMEIYSKSMEQSFGAVDKLLNLGVPEQHAYYLFPNALSLRMISSGDLLSYHHKWKLRSCYNAQEEIFRATTDEIEQVKAVFPLIGQHLRAPCYMRLRAGVKPYCPEGDRFCGLPVWKYDISQYERKSL